MSMFIVKGTGKGESLCIMQHAACMVDESLNRECVTDHPEWANHVVNNVAIRVNDSLGDKERQKLASLLPRILRATKAKDEAVEKRINVRLAIWAAKQITTSKVGLAAITAAEGWLMGTVSREECRKAAADAYAAYAAAYAAYAAAYDAADAAYAADAYAAYAAAYDAAYDAAYNPIFFLSDLLDAHEKAKAEEGVLYDFDLDFDYHSTNGG